MSPAREWRLFLNFVITIDCSSREAGGTLIGGRAPQHFAKREGKQKCSWQFYSENFEWQQQLGGSRESLKTVIHDNAILRDLSQNEMIKKLGSKTTCKNVNLNKIILCKTTKCVALTKHFPLCFLCLKLALAERCAPFAWKLPRGDELLYWN